MADKLEAVVSRLEKVATRLESMSVGKGSGGNADDPESDPIVVGYDEFMKGAYKTFRDLAAKIGGDVEAQAKLMDKAFNAQRAFMVLVAKCKTPSQDVLQKLLLPTGNAIGEVQAFREKNRGSKAFNNLSAMGEAIPALGWVTMVKGANHVKEMKASGEFYANRVLKDNKGKDQNHCDWVKAFNGMLAALGDYAKDYHGSGLSWNASGVDASTASAPAPPPAGAPPPPPAPPADIPPAKSSSGGGGSAGALFSEINQKGNNITGGLKKVSKDQMTHKNPNLRASSVVPDKAKPTPKPAAAAPKQAAKKPPVFELKGKKWIVEHQEDKQLTIDDTSPKYTVYIFNCKNTQIQIKGKVNSIVLDTCKKSALVFDECIATVEMVNCQSVQTQVNVNVPTISIDKTDGCQVYMSKASLKADIVTAKSSEMNILVPMDDGDFKEFALPEQYKTRWNGKRFITECTESLG